MYLVQFYKHPGSWGQTSTCDRGNLPRATWRDGGPLSVPSCPWGCSARAVGSGVTPSPEGRSVGFQTGGWRQTELSRH